MGPVLFRLTSPSGFNELAHRIASELVTAEATANGIRVITPVLYPSGTHVPIRATQMSERTFLVSDEGAASSEAEMMGAERIFARQARRAAEKCGVRFNSFELFEIEAPIDRLPAFIAIVADASRLAVEMTAASLAGNLDKVRKKTLADKLVDVYGADRVHLGATYRGQSTHLWEFDAIVKCGDRELLFNVTSPEAQSVSATYMKFDDIRRVDGAPRTVATLTNREAFSKDHLTILRRAALLIDESAPTEEFLKLAA